MTVSTSRRLIALILAAVLLTTRLHHFDVLPDASWAVFFLAGFYLSSPWIFAAFMVEAVTIDYLTTQHLGISSYCLSPAYAMLLPSYAALWFGGAWAARHEKGSRPLAAMELGASLLVSMSVCFLISNGSFYWLSGRVPSPNLAGWLVNLRQWYPRFLVAPCAYVGIAALVHLSARWLRRGSNVIAARYS